MDDATKAFLCLLALHSQAVAMGAAEAAPTPRTPVSGGGSAQTGGAAAAAGSASRRGRRMEAPLRRRVQSVWARLPAPALLQMAELAVDPTRTRVTLGGAGPLLLDHGGSTLAAVCRGWHHLATGARHGGIGRPRREVPRSLLRLAAKGDIRSNGEFVTNLLVDGSEDHCKWVDPMRPGRAARFTTWVQATRVDAIAPSSPAVTASGSAAGPASSKASASGARSDALPQNATTGSSSGATYGAGAGAAADGASEASEAGTAFARRIDLVGYALKSANDCPHRDPKSWRIVVDDKEVHSVRDFHFAARHSWAYFPLPHRTEFKSTFVLRVDEAVEIRDCIQLAQLALFQDVPVVPLVDAPYSQLPPAAVRLLASMANARSNDLQVLGLRRVCRSWRRHLPGPFRAGATELARSRLHVQASGFDPDVASCPYVVGANLLRDGDRWQDCWASNTKRYPMFVKVTITSGRPVTLCGYALRTGPPDPVTKCGWFTTLRAAGANARWCQLVPNGWRVMVDGREVHRVEPWAHGGGVFAGRANLSTNPWARGCGTTGGGVSSEGGGGASGDGSGVSHADAVGAAADMPALKWAYFPLPEGTVAAHEVRVETVDDPSESEAGRKLPVVLSRLTLYTADAEGTTAAPSGGGAATSSSDTFTESDAPAVVGFDPTNDAGFCVPRAAVRVTAAMSVTVAGDICGGGTGLEHAKNLLVDGNEDWNKWVDPDRTYGFGVPTIREWAAEWLSPLPAWMTRPILSR